MLRTTVQRLPSEVGTLYAELVEQLTALEARRSFGHAAGTFVTKKIKAQTYYYFQHTVPGGGLRQIYLGRQSVALDALAERFGEERSAVDEDRASVQRLCAELRAGGAATADAATGRVLGALADAAVFRLGGVLVGTHAFIALGNMLGVRWEHGLLRTDDIDIAAISPASAPSPSPYRICKPTYRRRSRASPWASCRRRGCRRRTRAPRSRCGGALCGWTCSRPRSAARATPS